MIIYKDIVNDDELISDSFDLKPVDGVVYEVQCKRITVGGEEINVGGNPSAEGGDDEGADDSKQTVLDIPYSMRLSEIGPLTKKQLLPILKQYFTSIKKFMKEQGKSEEDIKDFEKKAQPYAKKLIAIVNSDPKDITWYIGESGPVSQGEDIIEPMYVPFRYEGESPEPFAAFWIHGLKEMKV